MSKRNLVTADQVAGVTRIHRPNRAEFWSATHRARVRRQKYFVVGGLLSILAVVWVLNLLIEGAR